MTETPETITMEKPEFTKSVLEFFEKQKEWDVEHLWHLGDDGSQRENFIGVRGHVANERTLLDNLFMKRNNSIHNHPSAYSSAFPSANDLIISLTSGGVHYITTRDCITELIVDKPKWMWTAFKTGLAWESIVNESFIRYNRVNEEFLEPRLRKLLDKLSIKFIIHKMPVEPGRYL